MIDEKTLKKLQRITKGTIRQPFPVKMTVPFAGEYVIATDMYHLVGVPGTIEDFDPQGVKYPENISTLVEAGQNIELFYAPAKSIRKALRGFEEGFQPQIIVDGSSVRLVSHEDVNTIREERAIVGAVVNPLAKYTFTLIKDQWNNVLNLMGDEDVKVFAHLDHNWVSLLFFTGDRVGIVNGCYGDIAQFVLIHRPLWESEAEKAFNHKHTHNSAWSYSEATHYAPNINWDAYWNNHYTPEAAAVEVWQKLTIVPTEIKAEKVLIRWSNDGKFWVNIIIKHKDGSVRKYRAKYPWYNKVDRLLKYWGFVENKRIQSGSDRLHYSVLWVAPA